MRVGRKSCKEGMFQRWRFSAIFVVSAQRYTYQAARRHNSSGKTRALKLRQYPGPGDSIYRRTGNSSPLVWKRYPPAAGMVGRIAHLVSSSVRAQRERQNSLPSSSSAAAATTATTKTKKMNAQIPGRNILRESDESFPTLPGDEHPAVWRIHFYFDASIYSKYR